MIIEIKNKIISSSSCITAISFNYYTIIFYFEHKQYIIADFFSSNLILPQKI